MKASYIAKSGTLLIILVAFAGCSTWHAMDKTEGTALGAAGGAVAGAVVAGPVGAVVGGVGGGYTGHEVAGKDQMYSSSTTSPRYDPSTVCSVPQPLNDTSYSSGP